MNNHDMGWRKTNFVPNFNYWICAVLLALGLLFVMGFVDGVSSWGDKQAQCPKEALSMTIKTDGSVYCALKIDRDPAKVVREERVK